ncbi:hypothetical protein BDK51DRAFT_19836 [Blyttiomyces helicus]|uniref:HECT domain-containing protein n=1 Tax=Blyttiomyces helicus TaxID=388810 RepID=A0A4P9WJ35_9FUNG|nr:hypothetical protein BDK51DRAFT_19836 [Blyttiomyces helicus]|eukprot:RKO92921.1 hypothetical protein BDK51DRAFT_19836 [Blyttiomyces helicus]
MTAAHPLNLPVRLRAFLHVFLDGPTPSAKTANYHVPGAFRAVVQRLQESLSRTERFEVATAVPSEAGAAGASSFLGASAASLAAREAFNPSLQLARQLKLKLEAEDPASVPRPYSNLMVSVHAVATFKALEDYLKARIGVVPAAASGAAAPAVPASAPDVAAPTTQFSVEFFIGGAPVSRDTTVFGAVYREEQRRRGEGMQPNIWSHVCTVKYRKKAVIERGLRVKLPYPTTLPSTLPADAPSTKILHLLRLLHGLNTRWSEVYTESQASAAGAGIPTRLATLPPSLFANSKLTAKMNRQLDEPLIVASHVLPRWTAAVSRDFSFLVPFETRLVYLQSTAFGYSRSMGRWQAGNGGSGAGGGTGGGGSNDGASPVGRLPRQKVRISRSRIIDSMVKVMELYGTTQALLEVEFFDEVGTGLGPTLEFYSEVCREVRRRGGVPAGGLAGSADDRVFVWRDDTEGAGGEDAKISADPAVAGFINPAMGLFPAPITKEVAASEKGRKILHLFKSLGTFVAKALLDSRIVDMPFSPIFLEMVVGEEEEEESAAERALGPVGRKRAELHLLRHVDPALHTSLLELQKYVVAKREIDSNKALSNAARLSRLAAIKVRDASIDDLCLDFTLPGHSTVELVPGGRDRAVTIDTVEDYVDAVVEMTVGEGVRRQVEAFRKGFDRVFPVEDLRSFSVQEMAILVGGSEDEDWSYETLMDSIKADHGYTSESRTIRSLATMMSTFIPAQRRGFLQFVTGSPKLPIGGFRALSPPLTVVRKNVEGGRKPDDYLPSVMTCVNYLKVPDYSEAGVMRKRFDVAVAEGQGCFHLS